MKILQINSVYPYGSTGKIAHGIWNLCRKHNIPNVVAYGYNSSENLIDDTIEISTWLDCHIHNRLARITMLQGCFSFFRTKRFLKKVAEFSPDIIHLHNIHGSYINHGLLFKYIKRHNIKTIWTLHDCWAMTGYCFHFDMVNCNKWITGCNDCPQKKSDSVCLADNSKLMYRKKKNWFQNIDSAILVANSKWTAEQAKKSFLSQYDTRVIYNGIDLNIFKPKENDFRQKYKISEEYIVLGVAFGWNERKGLDAFIKLSKMLSDNYRIVLVGTNNEIDKQLPDNILSIHKTTDQEELADIYSAADVLFNPTREEAFGLVNIEALACGTPGVTFNTGGSPECFDSTCGIVIDKDDIVSAKNAICDICEKALFTKDNCVKRASHFNKENKFQEYIDLYREVVNE